MDMIEPETLTGKRILIAGGSSGMGLALARRAASEGAKVIIAGRSEDRLAEAQTKLKPHGMVETIAADITDEARVRDLVERCGRLDHIVSTAANIQGAYQLLSALELDAVYRVIDSKFVGPLLLAKYGARRLGRVGSITFTSGIAAYRPAPRGSVVSAMNGALASLVHALAVELGPIRVNAVSPGWVDTPIWDEVAASSKDKVLGEMAARLPVGRVGRPEDVADALRFMMLNTFVTGTVLHVDGGHRFV